METAAAEILEESEVLKMIADEKMRSEQHKTNYQILKIEHGRLQNENSRFQTELKAAREECLRIEEASKNANNQFTKQINELRSQLDLEKSGKVHSAEAIKSNIKEELDQLYREKYVKIQSEADKYRDDFNKIRYDFTFLKSEYEYLQQENARVLEEKKLKHETDVMHLRKEVEVLESKLSTESSRDLQQLQKLRRENSHLNLKVKNLLAELENLKSHKIQSKIQDDEVLKILNKQLAESAENLKGLEAEKSSLLFLKDGLKSDLSLCRENCASLTSECSSAQQEISRLRNEIEETKHQFKLRETDLKIEASKQSNEFDRENNKLSVVIQEQNVEIEVLKAKSEKMRLIIAEKEQELEMQRHAVEDKQFLKISELETDKSNLELELDNLQRRFKETEHVQQSESSQLREKISAYEVELEELKDQNEKLRMLAERSKKLSDDLEEEKNINAGLQERLGILNLEQKNLMEIQNELLSQRTTLKNALEKTNNDYRECKKEMKTLHELHSEEINALQSKLVSTRNEHEKTINALKIDATTESSRYGKHLEELRKKNNKYARLIKKLRQKLELAEAKIEELEIQKAVFSQSIPKNEYDDLRKKFKELQKRHSEFRSVISFVPQSMARVASPSVDDAADLNWRQLQSDDKILHDVKQRLETLTQQQQNEMEELKKLRGSS